MASTSGWAAVDAAACLVAYSAADGVAGARIDVSVSPSYAFVGPRSAGAVTAEGFETDGLVALVPARSPALRDVHALGLSRVAHASRDLPLLEASAPVSLNLRWQDWDRFALRVETAGGAGAVDLCYADLPDAWRAAGAKVDVAAVGADEAASAWDADGRLCLGGLREAADYEVSVLGAAAPSAEELGEPLPIECP